MKKKLLIIYIVSAILIPNLGFSATRDITINWVMSNFSIQDVQEFRAFSNYGTVVSSRIQLQNCDQVTETNGTTSMTCSDVTIDTYPVHFTVEAILLTGENITSASWTLEAPPAPPTVQDFVMLTPTGNAIPVADITATPASGTAPLTVDFNGSNSNDTDGTITSYIWDFGDGNTASTTEASTSHTFTTPNQYAATLKVVDNLGAASQPATISVTATDTPLFSLAVNFQESNNVTPAGFVKDYGLSFDNSNTPGYGWVGTLPTETRDRDNPLSPDQSYDTFIRGYPNQIWEVAVPNGTYKVSICVGDVSYPGDSIHSIQIEGKSLINQESTTAEIRWIEKVLNVSVSDGRLTVTFTGASQFTAFCWIKIESIENGT